MSASWREDDEEFRAGGVRGGLKAKPRFSFTEVKLLLEAVKRNRYIILRKFNQGVSAETKKQTWAEITNQINGLGENHREVRQIMKKWADLKCDGKRRIIALRGPNGINLRKKNLGPVERMVHKILMMSPRGDGESEPEFGEDEEFSKLYGKGPTPNPGSYSYLNLTDSSYALGGGGGGGGGASFDISPLSSPGKDLSDHAMDFDDNDNSVFSSYADSLPLPCSTSLDPLPDDARLRVKPVHTYSRNTSQNHTSSRPSPGPSSCGASTSSVFPSGCDADSSAAPPPPQSPTSSNLTGSSVPPPPSSSSSSSSAPPPASSCKSDAANDSTSHPATSVSLAPPPPAPCVAVSSSSSVAPTVTSAPFAGSRQPPPSPSDPLPAGASSRRARDQVAQVACQSLAQQRASRMLLTSVSRSLEMLAQSVQLLVETQQEFVQESLLLQRETVDILRDFSNTALTMLRDKANSGQLATHHQHHQPASRF